MWPGWANVVLVDGRRAAQLPQVTGPVLVGEPLAIRLAVDRRDPHADPGLPHDLPDEIDVAVDGGVSPATAAGPDDERHPGPVGAEQAQPQVADVRLPRPDPLAGAEVERAAVGGPGVGGDEVQRAAAGLARASSP